MVEFVFLILINGSVPISFVKYFLYSRAVMRSIKFSEGSSILLIILSILLSKTASLFSPREFKIISLKSTESPSRLFLSCVVPKTSFVDNFLMSLISNFMLSPFNVLRVLYDTSNAKSNCPPGLVIACTDSAIISATSLLDKFLRSSIFDIPNRCIILSCACLFNVSNLNSPLETL